LVLVHFSEVGTAPTWHVPERPEWGAPGWVGYETRSWNVRVHVQDLTENIPDTTHFVSVHGLRSIPQAKVTIDDHVYRQVMGDDTYALRHNVYGLGLAWLDVDAPLKYRFLVASTPVDEQYVDMRLLFLIHEGDGATELSAKGRSIIELISKNTSLDVVIWGHKVYRDRPPLVAGDGPIGVMRKWARQFYETASAPS
ncbi:MAG: Vanillate O-demethylase oxygenase subunit protein, partial [Ilumatobacteraceae bacterium]|nr:Vanillate O-demethylase oxygenase subunit protein [Ilumatobacteraceae bacterium]